jgi:transposase
MDAREQRGLVIAATCKITQHRPPHSRRFYVPSASQVGRKYTVDLTTENPTCTCPDWEEREMKCKHIYAVLFRMERAENPDGTTTVTETVTVSETIERKTTYKQDWPAYTAAQYAEKVRVQELLFDLCRNLTEPARTICGRKPHTIRDSIFSMVFKVYSTYSARRFDSDLREAHARGFLSKPVPGLKVALFMENPDFAPILKLLVHQSSLPLRAVETSFAIDSSGFGSSRSETWIDEKYGTPRRKAVWVKAHVASGTKTNVVTAVRILDKDSADSPQFAPLVKETAAGGFTIGEVSADKAYVSYENFEAVAGFGGEAFIAFKAGTTAARGGQLEKMFHYFSFKRDEYLARYHKRSNVESTFSAIKRKFGGEVRSKTDAAMVNEVLCKLVAHNLCCLNQEEHELGIDPTLWRETAATNVAAV